MFEKFRHDAGKTREEAAFRLHIAVRTLYNYEKGYQIPPPEIVCGMAKVYSDPSIPTKYCINVCPVGMSFGCPAQKNTAPGAA